MAGASLFTLIDDIALLLDDVSVMTKVAVQKTAGVLGDDLALNAAQVTGVHASRELPVVWRVALGSLVNKAILVPLALVISAIAPWAVKPLLMIGGLYLCFEGVEKLVHRWLHRSHGDQDERAERLKAIVDSDTDMVAFEKKRIQGAIRTDFVLSAEIIVISLGSVGEQPFSTQVGVLIAISLIMTVGVYGLVAGIVKLDDLGVWLLSQQGVSAWQKLKAATGKFLLALAPWLLKFLSIAGTLAMFLVGGNIIAHGLPAVHDFIHHAADSASAEFGNWAGILATMAMELVVGLACGAVAVAAWMLGKSVFASKK